MKLSDNEKNQLKLLYSMGFKFLARDDMGLCAYKEKPRLCISKNPACYFRSWVPTNKYIAFLDNDSFLKVGFDEREPYQITKSFNLSICKSTKKAVAI